METHKIAGNNMYMLRIIPKTPPAGAGTNRPALEVATENLEDILDWQKRIEDARNAIENHQHEVYKREQVLKQQSRSKRIALEMSDLVIYCRTVPFSLESELRRGCYCGGDDHTSSTKPPILLHDLYHIELQDPPSPPPPP